MSGNGNGAAAARDLAPRIDMLATSLRRHRAYNFALGLTVVVVVAILVMVLLDTHRDRQQRTERRVASAAQQLAACEERNRLTEAIDQGYQTTFAPGFSTAPSMERLSRLLDGLRGDLALSDCDTVLGNLTPTEASQARRSAAALPRIPLPPPTIPGYVPPPTVPPGQGVD